MNTRRGAVAAQICHALMVHATAEEEIFYPPAREAIGKPDLMDEADIEHACAKNLIAQIESLQRMTTGTTPASSSSANTSPTMSKKRGCPQGRICDQAHGKRGGTARLTALDSV